ncbi:MAG: hypothetical protein PVI99_07400, partial [Anaerolineales bacterium]
MNFVSSVNPNIIPAEMRTILKVVINSLPSVHSKRSYHRGIRDFLEYWVEKGEPVPDKLFLQ